MDPRPRAKRNSTSRHRPDKHTTAGVDLAGVPFSDRMAVFLRIVGLMGPLIGLACNSTRLPRQYFWPGVCTNETHSVCLILA